jgi:hypothetical protein
MKLNGNPGMIYKHAHTTTKAPSVPPQEVKAAGGGGVMVLRGL